MSESYTASFHNGGMEKDGIDSSGRKRKKLYQACREHNIRDPKYCDKQEHIIKGGVHEIWIDIPPKQAYEEIFGEAFREYNSKQRKKERQFNTYWEKVKKSAVLVPVREALITIGNCEDGFPDLEVGKQIYKEFLEEFQKKNPNMKVIGAYYHADEMRSYGKGGVIKGAPHMHLDYIPVAYKCDRGQKIQNSMNGALMEQGILNIEVDPEVAEKVYGLRKKPRRRKQNATLEEVPLSERLQCFENLEEKPEQTEQTKEGETEGGKITKPRVVTNLQQWTDTQRNRLKKIARSHGFEITEKNEKREHLTTEDYILSKNPNLNHDVHALAERLTNDLKEVQKESADNAEWEKENQEQAEQNAQTAKELEQAKEEHNAYVEQKEYDFKRKEYKLSDKEDELKEREEEATKKETFLANARKHVSESLHKFVQKLKKKKKEVEEKDRALDQMLRETKILAERAGNANDSKATPFYSFADDINFDDARLMASKRDGKGLCEWFNGLEHKFCGWLQKAQYFAKHFWNKTPDELMIVAEDMKQSYCSNLGEYIEKSMRGNTLSQIREVREIQEEIPKVQERKNKTITHTRKEIDWWD